MNRNRFPKVHIAGQIGDGYSNPMAQLLGTKSSDPRADLFDLVGARIAQTSYSQKHCVTNEEMNRRVNGPERLNSSSMACNLKRPKLRNGGELMRRQMETVGVKVSINQRQKAMPNKLIGMCESEVNQLVGELGELLDESYPTDLIARETIQEAPHFNARTAADLLECVNVFTSVLNETVPPITGLMPKASTDRELNHGLEEFSAATHGFGMTATVLYAQQMERIATAMIDECEVKKENTSPWTGN
ncbi:unnamed protein product [Caenorhabditis sp. 36 PRJEB53466]|nr:unnamed protein product [Caenorhabditis sp. 36 PRJEB53466]